jgi:hypothetical protein
MSLFYFPAPFPNELFYGLICRYSFLSGEKSVASINETLFGNRRLLLPIEFPIKLNEFEERCKNLFPYSTAHIINDYSLFPFYSKFLPQERIKRLKKIILRSELSNVRAVLGLNSSKIKSLISPRYCIECSKNDLKKYNQFYIHREHQLPLGICANHNTILESMEPQLVSFRYDKHISDYFTTAVNLSPRYNENPLLLRVSKIANSILLGESELSTAQFNYQEKLHELGFYRGKNINVNKLVYCLQQQYGSEQVKELIQLNVGEMEPHKYLMAPVNTPNKIFNPIRHILLMDFIESWYKQDNLPVKHLKKTGVCFNKASSHYLQNIISNINLKYDTVLKVNVTIFECECGMVYKKYFRDKKNGIRSEKIKITKYGPIWENKFKELVSDKLTSYAISKILGVDIRTIKHKRISEINSETTNDKSFEYYQASWTVLLDDAKINGKQGFISRARKKSPKIYSWLYKNAKSWLKDENLKFIKKSYHSQLRITWSEIDLELLKNLKTNYQNQIGTNKKRITKTLLIRSVRHIKNISNGVTMEKLPLSLKYIKSVSENSRSYKVRKLQIVLGELLQTNNRVSYSLLLAKANMRKPSSSIRKKIRKMIS